jgi:hypothetical protein
LKYLLCVIFALGICVAAAAVDFGLLINAEPAYTDNSEGKIFRSTADYIPWFSASINETTGLYVSVRLGLEDEHKNGEWTKDVFFELDRLELNIRPRETVYLTFGRQRYRDSNGMILAGNFDGFHGAFGLGRVRLAGSVFSTAFLRKETAEILMTDRDQDEYRDTGRYLGSNRMLAALEGDFPDLTSRTSLTLLALAQFDLNDYGDSALHSQYLKALYTIEATDALRFGITGIAGAMESGWNARGNFAAALELDWDIPGKLADMLTAELQWGSGAVNRAIGPFIPVSAITRGQVFTPTLSGIMDAHLSYTVRPHRTFSVNTVAGAFLRTDVETFTDKELDPASKDRYLGLEFYGQFIWAPQSPLRITAGGGAFFPGGAFVKDADPRWKINAGLILSL